MDKNIISIGSFDGMHLGHRKIIDTTIEFAKKLNAKPRIFTFVPLPSFFFNQSKRASFLTTSFEKSKLFEKYYDFKLEAFIFDEEISKLSAHEFVQNILLDKYGVVGIVMGRSHSFGKNRMGNFEWLEKQEKKYSLSVKLVPDKYKKGKLVNSSAIRNCYLNGDIKAGNDLLGYPFTYEDTIVHGDKRGLQIGFPTANFSLEDRTKLLPAEGIYATWVKHNGHFYKGMTYIGHRPTFEGIALRFETHILDFDKMIYGEKLRLFFMGKIRDDIKFTDVLDLIEQMNMDKKDIIQLLSGTRTPLLFL